MSPWGAGPDPADDEFMRRLFRKWDADNNKELTLQNVVVGFAKVKGSRDIMSHISYFFDLFDDDNDGRVDRDGMLRMSEALLFLGRRGFQTPISKVTSPANSIHNGASGPDRQKGLSDEEFLAAVSSFTRRCFEYADVDSSVTDSAPTTPLAEFSIGDDDDLVDLGDSKPDSPQTPRPSTATSIPLELKLPPMPSEDKPYSHRANAALDPAKPLFITLPTFRMLVLADETLEHFFDIEFPNSFKLADDPLPSASASSASNLTTFQNLGRRVSQGVQAAAPRDIALPGGGGVVPPGRQGLRGMLDNIVTDGMRVATEVRRRMEEAQKELDSAGGQQSQHDEDEDDDEADRKSIKDGDLLEGAEAAFDNGKAPSIMEVVDDGASGRSRTLSEASSQEKKEGIVEFER